MNVINSIKKYWRIYLLIIVTIASLGIIFSPVVGLYDIGEDNQSTEGEQTIDQKYTSLHYSIDLAGGTRIRAPLHGVTAYGVDIGGQDISEVESSIADKIENTESTEVTLRTPEDPETDAAGNSTIEVTSTTATEDNVEDALTNSDVTYEEASIGVTDATREEAVSVLNTKLDEAGLSGGSVRTVSSGEQELILVSVPNVDRQEAIDLITERGEVRIDIYYFDEEAGEHTTDVAVLEQDDFRTIGQPTSGGDAQGPHVPVTLTAEAAQNFQDSTTRTGVAQPGGSTCQYEHAPDQTEPCLLTVVDGEVVYSAGMAGSLADDIRSGNWADDPAFILQTESYEEAQTLSVNLRAGVLPAPLNIDAGETTFVSASQGEEFRFFAFIIGALSTLAVAGVISLRYGRPKIAVPMLITAFAEVIIVLALAALLKYPIDIAVIAGLIAVIGTGVDDLIIIADRVIGGRNPASSSKIFERRFRKALWIIMTAAGTTILALGPLAVMELHELQGFAIFTIVGVIAGVLITRPAYGDMLRFFFTEDRR